LVALLVSNVRWQEGDDPMPQLARQLRLPPERLLDAHLVKRSLDARHRRQTWRAAYRVEVTDEGEVLSRGLPSVRRWTERDDARYGLVDLTPARRDWRGGGRPIVVGAGPGGLFAALYLAEAGAPVLLLERGDPVDARVRAVNAHWRGRAPLDPESNLVFGEGGAGTFSDGKIYTRRRDGDLGYIFRRLVDFGADPNVLEESWAHLGTDRVRAILPVFRSRLRDLGAEVRFRSRVVDLVVEDGACRGVVLADGTVERGAPVVIAAGHAARDTAQMLVDAGVEAVARPIAVGVRIEHPQALIDRARYGADRGELPPATYRLSFNPAHGRRARTFCMCPGGMVVPAGNHPGRVVVNGMSFSARSARWANAAIIVEVTPEDYGSDDPLAGYAFQDRIEQACFEAAGGDGRAPAQRVVDLLAGHPSVELPRSSYPLGVAPCDLRTVLPDFLVEGLIAAIEAFEKEIPGFAGPEALLIAPETRTTSPVRFLRDDSGCTTTVADLYAVGEGAGYGGGIISCALDGYHAARAITAIGTGPR
jgi:uncharacterized FAD-dependent dehydrogenase